MVFAQVAPQRVHALSVQGDYEGMRAALIAGHRGAFARTPVQDARRPGRPIDLSRCRAAGLTARMRRPLARGAGPLEEDIQRRSRRQVLAGAEKRSLGRVRVHRSTTGASAGGIVKLQEAQSEPGVRRDHRFQLRLKAGYEVAAR